MFAPDISVGVEDSPRQNWGGCFREKISATLKATRRAYQFEKVEIALVDMAINFGGGTPRRKKVLKTYPLVWPLQCLWVRKEARLTNIAPFAWWCSTGD